MRAKPRWSLRGGLRRLRYRAAAMRATGVRDSETTKAVGLAAATMGANLAAVGFTVVFARILGADGYGSLAALLNLTIILMVPGSALQIAAAREGTLGRLGVGGELAATLNGWTRRVLLGVGVVAALSIAARGPLAALLNVRQEWAAAAVLPTGALWLLLCLQRGLLQSTRSYGAVGFNVILEAFGRLVIGAAFVVVGLGVTGAYLGTLASFALAACVLAVVQRRRLGVPTGVGHPLGQLLRGAGVPIGALVLVAVLQNVDVIMARHALDEVESGVYAAATVAGKAVVWIAVGLGFYVLPEATHRAAAGEDPRTVLLRALAVIGAIAAVALVAFATIPALLLRTAFGAEFETGDDILLVLGMAYASLAATYLAVQFLLGLHRRTFLVALGLAALAEPLLLLGAGSIESFAATVLSVQAVAAVAVLALCVRRPETAAPVTDVTDLGSARTPGRESTSAPLSLR